MAWTEIHEALFKKVNQELVDYEGRMQSEPGYAVYAKAEEIVSMCTCYNQLMSKFHDYQAEDLAPLLELEKPLEDLCRRWMAEQENYDSCEDFDRVFRNLSRLKEPESGPTMC